MEVRHRMRLLLWVLSILVIAVILTLAILAVAFIVSFSLPSGRFRDVVEDPPGEFTEHTGIEWPRSASVTSADDSHGGFHGDGEFDKC